MEYAIPDDLVRDLDGWAEAALPVFDAPPPQGELFARLRLIRSRRVGPATWRRLVGLHGSAVAAMEALPGIAAEAGDPKYRPADADHIKREIAAARKAGARLLTLGAPGYPAALADVADAPPVLWMQGRADLLTKPAVAVVGTRNASSLAQRMARLLGHELTEAGFVVVSGLARGVDAKAHEAALDGGTIAVHAGGLDRIYPDENIELGKQIAEQGCALTECAFGHTPQARDFPRRNRIVSGLSLGVIVVEAAARSGSMITARDAADQGREVMAVPGHPLDSRASGCNLLLRDGAHLVRGVDDVLEALAPALAAAKMPPQRDTPPATTQAAPAPDIAAVQAGILDLLSPVPVPEDQVLRDLARTLNPPPQVVAAQLSELELAGQIARRPGGGLVRV